MASTTSNLLRITCAEYTGRPPRSYLANPDRGQPIQCAVCGGTFPAKGDALHTVTKPHR